MNFEILIQKQTTEIFAKVLKFLKTSTYLYLCGTTTNIWLGPVQEDLSMTVLSTMRPISGQAIAVHPIRPPGFRPSLIQWVWL
jgi:hypothetical protein